MTDKTKPLDPFDIEGQEAEKERIAEAARVKRLIEIEDFKWLMAHKQGRRIVWKLLEQYGVYRSSFRSDALEMAFLEGQRNDGLKLLADIHEHAPERYADLMKEQKDARSSSSSSSSSKPGSTGASGGSSSSSSKPGSTGASGGSGSSDTRNE